MSSKKTLQIEAYTVGWVCALPKEQTAATAMLDERHESLPQPAHDKNTYTLGYISGHNVVIACLPKGTIGTNAAAVVAKSMTGTFTSIKFGLMVGIGGGMPPKVRLGDVVVSAPAYEFPGVVQWDLGITGDEGTFKRIGALDRPPNALLTAITKLETQHAMEECMVPKFVEDMTKRFPQLVAEYSRPDLSEDVLFRKNYHHQEQEAIIRDSQPRQSREANSEDEESEYDEGSDIEPCEFCDPGQRVKRKPREMKIHYGLIASGNQVVKDAQLREQINKRLEGKILCFDMEAAGLMNDFPCIVIRGICDYADSHKNYKWQEYAAAVAAGFAKEFLSIVPIHAVEQLPTIGPALLENAKQIVENTKQIAEDFNEQTAKQEHRYKNEKELTCLQLFKLGSYQDFKDSNQERVPGTCVWVLDNPKYLQWRDNLKNDLLWISADPGCGKSVLSRSLVEELPSRLPSLSICYFFFKDNDEQNSLSKALCALLHQLFSAQPKLLKHAMPAWEKNAERLQDEVNELWSILINTATDPSLQNVICVLDALDECRESDRERLLRYLSEFYSHSSVQVSRRSSLKFLVTSRPYNDIEIGFRGIPSNLPSIRLSGEKENDQIHQEIDLVIRQRVASLAEENQLSDTTTKNLERWLLDMEHRTYLWLHLAIKSIEETFRNSLRPDSESIESLKLPSTIDDAYEKILGRIKDTHKSIATKILHIIVGSRRPLTISEMAVALGLATRSSPEFLNPQPFAEVKIKKSRLRNSLRLCGLFVFIHHERIYLIHQTAKEFLIQKEAQAGENCWKYCLKPQDSEKIMATICIDYLLLEELNSISTKLTETARSGIYDFLKSYIQSALREEDKDGTPKVDAFLEYSAEHWPEHLRNSTISSSGPIFSNICHLYQTKNNLFNLWFPLLWRARRPYRARPDMNSIRLAAFNGHDIVVSYLLSNDSVSLEEHDHEKRTALIWAAELGYKTVVKLLLDKDANVNARGGYYGNPLQAASAGGHEAVVKLLLDKDADVNAQGGYYGNPLQAASAGGHEAVVKLLLDKDADVNAQGGDYGNPLYAASEGG
ncbi:putative ankyrin repeat-containing protein, partial [Amylocarpus encephaloides]